MYTSTSGVVGCVSKIPIGVERFFYAYSVIGSEVPVLLLLFQQLASPNGDDCRLIVYFITIVSEELEKKFPNRVCVLLTKPLEGLSLLVKSLLRCPVRLHQADHRQYWRISRLEIVDYQESPAVRAQSSTGCFIQG